jgi:hypothetical protein
MDADRQGLLRVGLNVDHRELQRLGGDIGGLLIFDTKP